jgi:hypothetical protein
VKDAHEPDHVSLTCARVGDHAQPQFRYVACPPGEEPVVIGETLASLAHAGPDEGSDTARELPDEALKRSYEAWAHARDGIVARWTKQAIRGPLRPRFRSRCGTQPSSSAKLQRLGGRKSRRNALVEKLEEAYPTRIQRHVREAMRSSQDPEEQAAAVAASVEALGLEPSPPPEPLPAITEDDVHLVCWLAILPAKVV